MQEVLTSRSPHHRDINCALTHPVQVGTVLLSEAQLPKPEQTPDVGRGNPSKPSDPRSDERNRLSALGVSHAILSTGVGAAVFYIGLSAGAGGLISALAGYFATTPAMRALIGDTGDQNRGNTRSLGIYDPDYARGICIGKLPALAATVYGACNLQTMGFAMLSGMLALGSIYGFIGRKASSKIVL